MKLQKILLIACIALVSIGVISFVTAVVLSLIGYHLVSDILLGLSGVFGILALAGLIYRLAIMAPKAPERTQQPKVRIKIVDVKDIPKSKEEQLFEQYENLYKQGLISQEDLEAKRKELMNK